MKWFWIPTVFYLVTQVKSWPTIGDGPPDPIKITSIEKGATETKICLSEEVIIENELYTLSVVPGGTIDYETTGGKDTKCLTFKFNLELIATKDYEFIVHHETDRLNYAEGKITNCPKFPTSSDYTMVKDPLDPLQNLIRMNAEGVKNLDLPGATLLINEGDIAYYHEITQGDPFETNPCFITTPENIKLCTDISIPLTDPGAVTVNSATLKLDVSKVNLQLETVPNAVTFDIIVTNKKGTEKTLSITNLGALTCEVVRENHGSDIFDIRVIGNTADKITATGSVTIHDRDLILSSIGETILEGIWLHTHEDHDKKLYQFQLLDVTPTVDPVNVDCTNLVSTHCYGYILDVQTDTGHSMKVKPMDGTPVTTDENQNIYTPPTPSQELAILSRHTKRHANQLMADVNICFEHLTPTEGRPFSHYEMLIINEKGQWLKHRIMEEEEEAREGRLCFTPFAINTRDFNLTEGTKVVVSQRGVDGFTVLATGQSKLL